MLSVKLKFRPSTIDGKEGSLYYRLIYKRTVRQVGVPFKIFEYEWNKESECINNNGSVNRKCYLDSVIWYVKSDLERFQNIYIAYYESNEPFELDDIIEKFNGTTSGLTLFIYIEIFLSVSISDEQYCR